MATAWPTLTRSEFDADKAVRTGRILNLIARDEVLREQAFSIYFADTTTTSATAVLLKTFKVLNYDAVIGKKLMLNLACYVSAGTGTWYATLGTSTSSNVTVTNTTPAARSGPPSPNAATFPTLVNAQALPEMVDLKIYGSITGGNTFHVAGAYDQWCWVED